MHKILAELDAKFFEYLLEKVSFIRILGKPYAFDFLKYTKLDNPKLREANDAIIEDRLDEVDVIVQSYQRELTEQIFILFDIAIQIKRGYDQEGVSLLNETLINSIASLLHSSGHSNLKMFPNIVIKWMNFEDEPEISFKIMNTIFEIDSQEESLTVIKDTRALKIFELGSKILPLLTNGEPNNLGDLKHLSDEISSQISSLTKSLEQGFSAAQFNQDHIHSLYNKLFISSCATISLLCKLNHLLSKLTCEEILEQVYKIV